MLADSEREVSGGGVWSLPYWRSRVPGADTAGGQIGCRHGEEVDGSYLTEVVAQEGRPVLSRPSSALDYVAGDSGLAEVVAEFEQLTVDSGSAPGRVLA